jgi:hypothetical protein
MKKSFFATLCAALLSLTSLCADINLNLNYQGNPYQANLALNTPTAMVSGVNSVNVTATLLEQDNDGATVCLTFQFTVNGQSYNNKWPNYYLNWGTPAGATDFNGDPIWTLVATPITQTTRNKKG